MPSGSSGQRPMSCRSTQVRRWVGSSCRNGLPGRRRADAWTPTAIHLRGQQAPSSSLTRPACSARDSSARSAAGACPDPYQGARLDGRRDAPSCSALRQRPALPVWLPAYLGPLMGARGCVSRQALEPQHSGSPGTPGPGMHLSMGRRGECKRRAGQPAALAPVVHSCSSRQITD